MPDSWAKEDVAYPFHPLFPPCAIVRADNLHDGSRHLTLRDGDHCTVAIPAWMIDLDETAITIVDLPRISIARLLGLIELSGSNQASSPRRPSSEGEANDEARKQCAACSRWH